MLSNKSQSLEARYGKRERDRDRYGIIKMGRDSNLKSRGGFIQFTRVLNRVTDKLLSAVYFLFLFYSHPGQRIPSSGMLQIILFLSHV